MRLNFPNLYIFSLNLLLIDFKFYNLDFNILYYAACLNFIVK